MQVKFKISREQRHNIKLKAKVPHIYNGFTLIDYVSARFDYLAKEEWRLRIAEGRHSRAGVVLGERDTVCHLDEIVYDMPDIEEEPANLDYNIIMQTKDFLLVNKPANLTVHKCGLNFRHNLIYQLRETHKPPFKTADTVNRLDKDTSGIVVVSLNKKALKELSEQFVERTMKKTYFAVVVGKPSQDRGVISSPIAKIQIPSTEDLARGRFVQVGGENAKESETEYELVETKGGHSLIKLFPKTGRTHQLRIHLASIGLPIVGDLAYGLTQEEYAEYCVQNGISPKLVDRHLLHCAQLEFSLKGSDYLANCPLPTEFWGAQFRCRI